MSLMQKTVSDFLSELASESPAPGGGSIAALSGSLGCALTSMCARLCLGKKKYEAVWKDMEDIAAKADEARAQFEILVDKDTEAYNGVMAAFKLPKETDQEKAERKKAIIKATTHATLVPLETLELAAKVTQWTLVAARDGNPNSLSDAGVAGLMLSSALDGADYNIAINLAGLPDDDYAESLRERASSLRELANRNLSELARIVAGKIHG